MAAKKPMNEMKLNTQKNISIVCICRGKREGED
jgi:hypothetical protein